MAFGKRSKRPREVSREEESEQHTGDNQSEESHPMEKRSRVEDEYQLSASLKPLLAEVEIHAKVDGKNPGGVKKWTCNHCKRTFTSSYTRIHYHFLGAPPGTKAQVQRCPTLLINRTQLERVRKMVEAAEEKGVSFSLTRSTIANSQKASPNEKSIADSFKMMERHSVDLLIEKAFCANGIPFNVLRSPSFVEMVKGINHAPKDYKAPSYDKARLTLLNECKRDVEKDLVPLKDTWYVNGVSIVSDGWTNIKHKPLINVIAANNRGSMFLYAENFEGVEKTGKMIASFLLKAVEEIGPSNVLQVVTDNASNCKTAGKEIEKVHKHIFWSSCVVHTLNLIFKDFITEFSWIQDTHRRAKDIVKFFINHSQALALFRANSALELLKVAKTRFVFHHILLKRMVKCRESLATTVVLMAWKEWVRNNDEKTRTLGEEIAAIIGDEEFWDEVYKIVAITKPIYLMIKFSDGEGQKMGEVYERMDCMLGEITDLMKNNTHTSDLQKMQEILVQHWEKLNIPMHCLGFSLNPHFYDLGYLRVEAPGGVPRRPPNQDLEVVKGVMMAFEKIGEDGNERKLLREQLSRFQSKEGIFGSPTARTDAVTMNPISWWCSYGSETPELAEIALKVLSQPISSSSAERVWSTYSFIHNAKRNKLNATRADKLVFIHSNMRLLSRCSESYKKGPSRKWDINPENTFLDDSAVRLEDANWE